MTLIFKQLRVPVKAGDPSTHMHQTLAQELNLPSGHGFEITVKKKSLDARKKSQIYHQYQVLLSASQTEEAQLLEKHPDKLEQAVIKPETNPYSDIANSDFRHMPVIVGSGPAGTFAALVLAEAGHPCIIVERGEPVESRSRTVHRLLRTQEFNPESNYCFGEGGAGTFSDGKLTCGRNHPLVQWLFEQWVRFGAPEDILQDAHPHIGTDYLMVIAKKMRVHLESLGCEFLFGRKFMDIQEGDSSARLKVVLDDGRAIPTDHFVLAIGHSARDTYKMLLQRNVAMAPKPFAIGARIEHPQEQIDQIQFGSCTLLPAAEYKLAARAGTRGIWTFCMCPGGHLMPTAAQPEHLAINGMSYHARNSGFANAAVVVNVNREDFFRDHVLDGMNFQAEIEQKAYRQGGGGYFSPAQRMEDFIAGRLSRGDLKSSYKPGVTSARLDKILPDFVVESLRGALTDYNKRMRGYISSEAMIAGVETKTSAPIVIHRGKDFMSPSFPGLFPAGEGAGYAGGIVSAGLDGVRTAQAVLKENSTHKPSRILVGSKGPTEETLRH